MKVKDKKVRVLARERELMRVKELKVKELTREKDRRVRALIMVKERDWTMVIMTMNGFGMIG